MKRDKKRLFKKVSVLRDSMSKVSMFFTRALLKAIAYKFEKRAEMSEVFPGFLTIGIVDDGPSAARIASYVSRAVADRYSGRALRQYERET